MQKQSNYKKNNEFEHDINKPPYSLEAEQAVLGGIMLDNLCWDLIENIILPEDFYTYAHRVIFQEMIFLYKHSQPIDAITLDHQLNIKGLLDDVGGFAYLAELAENIPSVANIIEYAKIIRDKSILRALIATSNEIAKEAFHPAGQATSQILDNAERKILAISEKRASSNEPEEASIILERTLQRIELLHKKKSSITGLSTGFADLDTKTAGLQNSDLIILAARPSMGKTTFAVNICENVAFHANRPVLIFSLEMPSEQLMMRMLSSLSKIEQDKIRTGQLTSDADWAALASVMGMMQKNRNIYIDDSSELTPNDVRTKTRRLHKELENRGGLGLIMIDYLQLMRVPGNQESRHLEIAEISRSLKSLAKELKIPVIALSQLNRGLEQRADKRPINSDLRESGSIEQDADLIMFLYRDWVYNKSAEPHMAELIIGKQRNGPIGTIDLIFNGQYSKFESYAKR